MRMSVVHDKSGKLIGTYEAGEVQTAEGTIEVSADTEDGQQIEEIEVKRYETFDIDALHQRLARKAK